MRLCVFDFDSTLMDGETIDFIAEEANPEYLSLDLLRTMFSEENEEEIQALYHARDIGRIITKITDAAMNGKIDFFRSLSWRVSLLKGVDRNRAVEICRSLPWMPGARETVAKLKEKGMTVVCFSGGFRWATDYGQEMLGYDASFANVLHVWEGKLTGLVGGDMMFDHSKGDLLKRLQKVTGISQEETMVVGDGANDRSMFREAGLKVAFCGKEVLKKEADVCVETKDLREVLKAL